MYTYFTVLYKEEKIMELDFSMVEFSDILEYFRAVLNVFLKIFGLELDGNFQIGGIKIEITKGQE